MVVPRRWTLQGLVGSLRARARPGARPAVSAQRRVGTYWRHGGATQRLGGELVECGRDPLTATAPAAVSSAVTIPASTSSAVANEEFLAFAGCRQRPEHAAPGTASPGCNPATSGVSAPLGRGARWCRLPGVSKRRTALEFVSLDDLRRHAVDARPESLPSSAGWGSSLSKTDAAARPARAPHRTAFVSDSPNVGRQRRGARIRRLTFVVAPEGELATHRWAPSGRFRS